jgi:radical SAM superfamily enzyme YgiQ (UPF0313 family)
MRTLLVTPPLVQLNGPYPATTFLCGWLRSQGRDAVQADLSIELVLRLFSRDGLDAIRPEVEARARRRPLVLRKRTNPVLRSFLEHFEAYRSTVDAAVGFLQGHDPGLAHRIVSRRFLPEGPRFVLDEAALRDAFGALGVADRARYLATLYLDDLADVVRGGVDPRFGLVRYAESLAASQPSYDPLAEALESETLVDGLLDDLVDETVRRTRPDLVAITAPFPGNAYGAFRVAKGIRERHPGIRTALGGGWVNTELRDLREPRVFDHFDFVTLDDGERPIVALLEHLEGRRPVDALKRTFIRVDGAVRFVDGDPTPDVPYGRVGAPVHEGLPLNRYLGVLEMLNPMHRLWSDTRWNKLVVAHGCYWKKCSFCDTSLDYIARFDAVGATTLVDRMEAMIAETGTRGFHFVDEAAPPNQLRAMAEEILRRGLAVAWWGNIRFEKAFTPDLCELLARSGCVAVTGGLEVASDRLLGLMNKGVTVAQVARVSKAFVDAGVLVHAYLMYGFPTQTAQDTVDALELVRQMFEEGCLQSAFWHRFAATVHSPVGRSPERYGVTVDALPEDWFARNDLAFHDPTGTDHDALAPGLNRALYNYMHGVGLDEDVRAWFDVRVPKPGVRRKAIRDALREGEPVRAEKSRRGARD